MSGFGRCGSPSWLEPDISRSLEFPVLLIALLGSNVVLLLWVLSQAGSFILRLFVAASDVVVSVAVLIRSAVGCALRCWARQLADSILILGDWRGVRRICCSVLCFFAGLALLTEVGLPGSGSLPSIRQGSRTPCDRSSTRLFAAHPVRFCALFVVLYRDFSQATLKIGSFVLLPL